MSGRRFRSILMILLGIFIGLVSVGAWRIGYFKEFLIFAMVVAILGFIAMIDLGRRHSSVGYGKAELPYEEYLLLKTLNERNKVLKIDDLIMFVKKSTAKPEPESFRGRVLRYVTGRGEGLDLSYFDTVMSVQNLVDRGLVVDETHLGRIYYTISEEGREAL